MVGKRHCPTWIPKKTGAIFSFNGKLVQFNKKTLSIYKMKSDPKILENIEKFKSSLESPQK